MSHLDFPLSRHPKPGTVAGKHFIVELGECNSDLLRRVETVKPVLEKAAHDSHATSLHSHYHQFEPFGVSGFILIAESHISIHTWPEYDYASLDIQTCGDEMNPKVALEVIANGLGSRKVRHSAINRGI